MRAPASLRGRLALWLGLALVALWLATALLTAGLMRRELDALFDSALQESAERLLPLAVNDVLGRGPADENDEDDPRILGVIAPHDEFLTYVLRDPAGRVLLQSHAVDPAGFPPWDGPGLRSTATLRLYNIAALRDTVRLTVAEPLAHRARIAREALWMLLLPLLVVVPLAFAAIWLALRAGLAPLQRWRERLAARGARDLSPVSAGDLPSELAPIAATLDDVLCRLSAAFEAERSFAANAAHELRTPLAGAIAQAQRLQAETADPAARMRAAAMEAALKRLLRVSERLMQLARAEGARLRRDSAADLCPVVRILVEEQGRDAGDERIRLRLPEAAVLSDLDPDALAIILRNLIDNALRHGDPAKPVDVTLTSEGILRVSNDGLPIPPETLARLATRFTRAGSSAEGSGLGLAIVATIAERIGSRLHLTSPRPGATSGLTAEMMLPCASDCEVEKRDNLPSRHSASSSAS
ncbi:MULTISPECIES: sensor histidine kinase [Paracoccus]|uniref:histidine kinase n=2 Tax=Paracoccus TaxID=265 RepID=A0A1I3EYT4_9RHOB|nr:MULTISPECIES: HAMP domain-containing sensor histidine kinase [Paracoccus]RCW78367.1 two-component system OmpR family sensor kinase [Paracoccus lutimaris]CQR86796.1 signal transduction histidine kinase [Paracoccus aminovorans]SFI04138.1 two-component system, OmpR family, sensor kinase [Paracoccus aminovorans]